MYCKMCGNLLDDTDLSCKICGTEVEHKEKPIEAEEIVYNPDIQKISDENEFSWNIHEFTKERKTQDIVFDWGLDPVKENEPDINVVKIDEPIRKIETELQASENTSEHQFNKINDNEIRNQTLNIDKLFTFNKKNEEFQVVLDKEFETIRNSEPSHINIKGEKLESETKLENVSEESIPGIDIEIQPSSTIKYKELEVVAPIIQPHLKEMSDARASFFRDDIILENETIKKKYEVEKNDTIEESQDIEGNATIEESQTLEKRETVEEQFLDSKIDMSVAPQDPDIPPIVFPFEYEDSDKLKEKKGCLGKGFLIIVAIILLIEIIILGFKYFAPDSTANVYIVETQTRVVNVVTEWVDKFKELVSGADSNEPIEQGQPSESSQKPDVEKPQDSDANKPDPTPTADKAVLVNSQLYNNDNIQQVKANDSLTYTAGKDYKNSDINNSKSIANNIWLTSEGEKAVYYDSSIVGTLIAFDSQWIDYVNEGNKQVFDLIKSDSKAYQNAVSFSKIGKVKETFNLLEIGEIRQGSKGFYAWVHEEIQIIENGLTVNRKYNWIYYLEPIGDQIKIVNYYKY